MAPTRGGPVTEHRIVSAVLVPMTLPEIDASRMLKEWRGGRLITRDVEREVYSIRCSCGDYGHAFEFSGIQAVFETHLGQVQ
jgi:hypothetical protein